MNYLIRDLYELNIDLDIKFDIIIKSIITVRVYSGEASADAPLGPLLGQYGILVSDFCIRFNNLTSIFEPGLLLNTKIILYSNMNYDIYILSIDVIYCIKYALNISKLSPFGKRIFLSLKTDYFCNFISTPVLYEIIQYNYKILKYKNITLKQFFKCVCNMLRNSGVLIIPRIYLLNMRR
jgi:ribosomal protein L11